MSPSDSQDTIDRWKPFQFFLGSWNGTASGHPGIGSVDRNYSLILADQFIEVRNRSVYPPQEANPSGEIHEDLALISYDKSRSLYVMREFHVEGYVNQYILEPPADGSQSYVFVTESIENISTGWRARTTLEVNSGDSFQETFDLAGPDQEWVCYITNEFTRSQNG
ncbi:hypothetical protein ES703_48856 [subsurface metagenome]